MFDKETLAHIHVIFDQNKTCNYVECLLKKVMSTFNVILIDLHQNLLAIKILHKEKLV